MESMLNQEKLREHQRPPVSYIMSVYLSYRTRHNTRLKVPIFTNLTE